MLLMVLQMDNGVENYSDDDSTMVKAETTSAVGQSTPRRTVSTPPRAAGASLDRGPTKPTMAAQRPESSPTAGGSGGGDGRRHSVAVADGGGRRTVRRTRWTSVVELPASTAADQSDATAPSAALKSTVPATSIARHSTFSVDHGIGVGRSSDVDRVEAHPECPTTESCETTANRQTASAAVDGPRVIVHHTPVNDKQGETSASNKVNTLGCF